MQQFYFLHIPKTAGVTLSYSVLNQYFSAAETLPAVDYGSLFNSDLRRLNHYRLFRGHFYHFFVRMLPAMPTILTFLRDPIERIISTYEYMRHYKAHYQHKQTMAFRSIVEWLESPFFYPNSTVTALAADLDPFSFATRVRARFGAGADLDAFIHWTHFTRRPGRAELERAKERLASYAFIGLTERFDESLQLLRHTFNWPEAKSHIDQNMTPGRLRREELTSSAQQLLIQTHDLDLELYHFAKRLFEARLAQMRQPQGQQWRSLNRESIVEGAFHN